LSCQSNMTTVFHSDINSVIILLLLLRIRLPPVPTLFPYTTLFRSRTGTAGVDFVWDGDRVAGVSVQTNHNESYDILAKKTIVARSEEHTSELQSRFDLVCRLLLEKKKNNEKVVIEARV